MRTKFNDPIFDGTVRVSLQEHEYCKNKPFTIFFYLTCYAQNVKFYFLVILIQFNENEFSFLSFC
jgi:hypothetical protein